MFLTTCTACTHRYLIFPSQFTSMVNTDHGIVVDYTCWCGAEQSTVTGSRTERAHGERIAA